MYGAVVPNTLIDGTLVFVDVAIAFGLMRNGASDDDLDTFIKGIWTRRADRYSEIRSDKTVKLEKIEMSYIGG